MTPTNSWRISRYMRPTSAGATIIGSIRIAISHGRRSRSGARKMARHEPEQDLDRRHDDREAEREPGRRPELGIGDGLPVVAEADDLGIAERLEADLRERVDDVEDEREAEEDEQEQRHRREEPQPLAPALADRNLRRHQAMLAGSRVAGRVGSLIRKSVVLRSGERGRAPRSRGARRCSRRYCFSSSVMPAAVAASASSSDFSPLQ